jgi:hypothetical protein
LEAERLLWGGVPQYFIRHLLTIPPPDGLAFLRGECLTVSLRFRTIPHVRRCANEYDVGRMLRIPRGVLKGEVAGGRMRHHRDAPQPQRLPQLVQIVNQQRHRRVVDVPTRPTAAAQLNENELEMRPWA